MTFRLILCALLLAYAPAALAERVALVIGNSAYENANPLPNAATDAGDMATRLTELGFAVYSGLDLTRVETLALVDEFSTALHPEDLALFYYAGHGAQIGTENYMIPIDASASDEVTLTDASVKLQTILRTMELRADRRIVILDACRNNPFVEQLASRAVGDQGVARGLAKVEAGVGSYIAFSTQPGNVARDGKGRNSPFTEALLRHIGAQGADIHAIMRQVRADVVAQTNQAQVPWENSSLVDEVFLSGTAPPPPEPATKARISRPATSTVAEPPTVLVGRYYVGGLDPNGDGFLSLRAGPSGDADRLASLLEGTALEVLTMGDPWWEVRTLDGLQGYAHSDWIQCCTQVAVPLGSAPDATLQPLEALTEPVVEEEGDISCDQLWHSRNRVWHDYGYCFTTDRAISVFGNDGCQQGLDRGAIALTDTDRSAVDRIVLLEKIMGCN